MIESSFMSLDPHGFHRVAYTEWGRRADPHVVMCVHGLTRNGRDFDTLARALDGRCRLVCMDVAGRGRSDWLEHKEDYTFHLYQADAAALMARATNVKSGLPHFLHRSKLQENNGAVDWIGTSMGGLIGMLIAAQPRSPIRRLVLNDVGPFIPWAALIRLKGYFGTRARFDSLEEVERAVRESCAQWGPMTDDQWRHLTAHSAQKLEDGTYRLAVDPAVGMATAWGWSPNSQIGTRNLMGLELWSTWEAIRCPTLVLRGANSDVLETSTVERMLRDGPPTQVVELPGIGHAPSLMRPDQIQVIRRFLI